MSQILKLTLASATLGAIALGVAAQPANETAPPEAKPTAPAPPAAYDPVFLVSRFIPQYLRDHPQLPPLDDVLNLQVRLAEGPSGYAAAREGTPAVVVKLRDLNSDTSKPYHASAIQRILERVRDHYNAKSFMGVYVAPDPFEIDENGKDLRAVGATDLHLIITVGTVTELRTLASGERVNPDRRVNADEHALVRRQSPLQPPKAAANGAATAPAVANVNAASAGDLLRRDKLDDYAFWLSRHPGRRADVALSPGVEAGSVNVDYLLTENKPWSVFAQVSNTGTEETNEWRERFGFFHNQLTGNDDIFSLDYLTAGFENTHAVNTSYEAPIGDSRWFRWRVSGAWSEFTASDVGFGNDTFTGEDWNIGGELIATVFQKRDLFIDVLAGVRYQHTEVDNTIPGTEPGEEDFLLPHVGVRLDQMAEWYTNRASVTLEWQSGNGVSQDEIDNMGRADPDDSWVVLQWDLSHSVYLEPLLDRKKWQNPNAPEATLAHEMYFGFRGQYAFDYRLIPNAEQVVGGFYTVRGYPESAVAGDTVVVGTAEYRFHLPRAFAVQPEPGRLFDKPFRWAPQYPYGTPDWDLILRAFIDAGRAMSNNGEDFFEDDATLVGAGFGAEFLFKRNFSARVDWGVALKEVPERGIDAGSNRFHFVFTVLY